VCVCVCVCDVLFHDILCREMNKLESVDVNRQQKARWKSPVALVLHVKERPTVLWVPEEGTRLKDAEDSELRLLDKGNTSKSRQRMRVERCLV
jgi:hypothetical protein